MAIKNERLGGFELNSRDFVNLTSALKKLPVEYQARILRAVNRKIGETFQSAIIRNAPHADHRNNRVLASKESVIIANNYSDKTGVIIGVDSRAFWARFVNYGTDARYTKGRGKRIKVPSFRGVMPITPFFDRGFNQSVNTAIDRINKEYNDLIYKALTRLNKSTKKKIGK